MFAIIVIYILNACVGIYAIMVVVVARRVYILVVYNLWVVKVVLPKCNHQLQTTSLSRGLNLSSFNFTTRERD